MERGAVAEDAVASADDDALASRQRDHSAGRHDGVAAPDEGRMRGGPCRGRTSVFLRAVAGTSFAPNELRFHCIRVPGDATNAEDLTRAEMQGRKDCWTMYERFKKNIPAFEKAYFICTFPYIGIRETRRIDGEYVLTEDDLMKCTSFDDAVATGTWYMDVHPNAVTLDTANIGKKLQPKAYDIPYRTLLPRKVDNLLVAGRCHSATPMASASTRVNCTAMAMGQAAGYAAALAIRNGTDLRDHDGVKVARCLRRAGRGRCGLIEARNSDESPVKYGSSLFPPRG